MFLRSLDPDQALTEGSLLTNNDTRVGTAFLFVVNGESILNLIRKHSHFMLSCQALTAALVVAFDSTMGIQIHDDHLFSPSESSLLCVSCTSIFIVNGLVYHGFKHPNKC